MKQRVVCLRCGAARMVPAKEGVLRTTGWDWFKGQLLGVEREGIRELVAWLDVAGMAECPASSRFHGAHPGGLVEHCLNVYDHLVELDVGLVIPQESLTIATLLHDVCKVGAYVGEPGAYKYNNGHRKGHAALSLEVIRKYIRLTELEEQMIRYHMGPYGTYESGGRYAEYPLLEWVAALESPAVKLMYFADNLAALDEDRGA